MAFVVTGAAGFIGSHLVEALAAAGHEVIGIDRRAGVPAAARHEIVADLVSDAPDVTAALAGADAVLHLAGCPGVRITGPDVEALRLRDNVVAGARVLAAVPNSVRVVVVSSSSVYGGALHDGVLRPSREGDSLRPTGGYARSKVALEDLALRRAAAGGAVTIVRPFTVAGERQRPDMALARWILAASEGTPLTILGSPGRMRDVTDVADVIAGLIGIVERDVGGTFNLGSGHPRSLTEMATAVCDVLGVECRFNVEPAGSEEVAATWASIDRARSLLDYEPSTDLSGIVRRQVTALQPA
ncbi:MAG TPA: NAD(P)-dependent oxidoreductase [Actinomycetota bacterium]|nr:NAD(P)-dependent oxidoreductase [Actinomycetota bacterium]